MCWEVSFVLLQRGQTLLDNIICLLTKLSLVGSLPNNTLNAQTRAGPVALTF